MQFRYTFPLDAEYSFKVRARSSGLGVGAGAALPELEITIDGVRVKPTGTEGAADLRIEVKAGPHTIGAALKQKNLAGVDDIYATYANNAGVQSVAITGPLKATGRATHRADGRSSFVIRRPRRKRRRARRRFCRRSQRARTGVRRLTRIWKRC